MKKSFSNSKFFLIILIILFVVFLSVFYLSNSSNQINLNTIILNKDENSFYSKVIKESLPSYNIKYSKNEPYCILNAGAIGETFDVQAKGGLEAEIANYWYPHYLVTVIIAVDRDQTDVEISTWEDLFSIKEEVGFFDTPGDIQILTAGMSYGLEGKDYTLRRAIDLLSFLNKDNRLNINTFKSPITICYDYQAVNLMEKGRNLEIIIPSDGTYTYEKGIVSNEKLDFPDNMDGLLLAANFRLLDGESDSSFYPDKSEYSSGTKIKDYKHLSWVSRNIDSRFQRDVLKKKISLSMENFLFILIFLILITLWEIALLRRSIQKSLYYAVFFISIILTIWILFSLIKFQFNEIQILSRYLWYSFYVFQLLLPLVLLWMAWAIDKPEDQISPPIWWKIIGIFAGVLAILSLTNDFHGLVLDLNIGQRDWRTNFNYGLGHYIILFNSIGNLFGMFLILIKKSIKGSRKKEFLFPIGIFILFIIYNYLYVNNNVYIFKTDFTIMTSIFTMLILESCIWSGLIPVNKKYIDIFTQSPLKMQIVDKKGEIKFNSALAKPINIDIFERLIHSPMPIWQDNLLLFSNPIPGGYLIWQEDVKELYQLSRRIKESNQMLIEANAILAEEKNINSLANHRIIKKELMDQLEREIAESLKNLSIKIESLSESNDYLKESTSIAILLSYIKRRCNFFFKGKEKEKMDIDELINYVDEFSQIIQFYNVQIINLGESKGKIPIRYANLFYKFSYLMADLIVEKKISKSIQNIKVEDNHFSIGFLTSKDLGEFKLEDSFIEDIEKIKGKVEIKDLGDTIGIKILFPKNGVNYD